jgi:hypothetical protein
VFEMTTKRMEPDVDPGREHEERRRNVSSGEFSEVADGETAEWLDDDTLIVSP